jgi:hypothetical protein
VRAALVIVDAVRLARRPPEQNVYVAATNSGRAEDGTRVRLQEVVVQCECFWKRTLINCDSSRICINASNHFKACKIGAERQAAQSTKTVKRGRFMHPRKSSDGSLKSQGTLLHFNSAAASAS